MRSPRGVMPVCTDKVLPDGDVQDMLAYRHAQRGPKPASAIPLLNNAK